MNQVYQTIQPHYEYPLHHEIYERITKPGDFPMKTSMVLILSSNGKIVHSDTYEVIHGETNQDQAKAEAKFMLAERLMKTAMVEKHRLKKGNQ